MNRAFDNYLVTSEARLDCASRRLQQGGVNVEFRRAYPVVVRQDANGPRGPRLRCGIEDAARRDAQDSRPADRDRQQRAAALFPRAKPAARRYRPAASRSRRTASLRSTFVPFTPAAPAVMADAADFPTGLSSS